MQRFGVPTGIWWTTRSILRNNSDKYKRKIPGRIVGQSVDAQGNQSTKT